ncbi:MAG: hypothetical protein Q9186_007371 [Xanthomendoza sp. 1 TL-2023]
MKMKMKIKSASIAVLSITALLSRSSATLVKDEMPSLQQQAANLSVPDPLTALPQFTWKVHIKMNAPLDPVSMMMVAADALTLIALKDHRSNSPETHFHNPEEPDVVIDLIPKRPATEVSNEVATLCIYHGLEDMIRHRQFQECTIACELDHVEVAIVNIWNTSSTPEAAKDSSMIETTNLTGTFLQALEPRYEYLDRGADINIAVAFVTVMYGIMTLSTFRSSDTVPPCHTTPGLPWDASIVFPGDGPRRWWPPFFEYRYAIDTLNLALHYMLRHGKFAELRISISVDGDYLGRALLMKGRPWRSIPLLPSMREASA